MPYVRRYNKRNKRHVVFWKPPEGGLWRIEASFPTKKEADRYIREQE